MLCSAQPSVSQDAIATTSFEDWSVFEDEVACWAASEAFQEPGVDTSLEQHLMFVTFFYGVQIPEISFNVGSCCGASAYARSNNNTLPLFYEDENYFPTDSEIDFLLQILRGEKLELLAKENNEVFLWFSLLGFREAYNHLAKTCEFNPITIADEFYRLNQGWFNNFLLIFQVLLDVVAACTINRYKAVETLKQVDHSLCAKAAALCAEQQWRFGL